jgi:hypothetical protein
MENAIVQNTGVVFLGMLANHKDNSLPALSSLLA